MKRRITKLVVLLLLGAVVNVAVAWGMRLWSELHRYGSILVTRDEVPGELLPPIVWRFGPFAARRFIRVKHGHCIKCSYDLRGNSGGVCPECGATTR